MSRIPTPATITEAPEASRPILENVQKQLGSVPNIFRLVSNSPAALAVARGAVGPQEIEKVRAAGYSDAEILEIIGHVAVNTFSNYVNEALGTEIDFPRVEPRAA